MKTNCDIIRDLLPLYAEHITSEATNALVEEHLAECEACRAELEQMEQPVPVRPEAQPDAPLRRIRAALQRRSIRAAIGSVLAALCALAMATPSRSLSEVGFGMTPEISATCLPSAFSMSMTSS